MWSFWHAHGNKSTDAEGLLAKGLKVIDLSADFRYRSQSPPRIMKTLSVKHLLSELLEHAFMVCAKFTETTSQSRL